MFTLNIIPSNEENEFFPLLQNFSSSCSSCSSCSLFNELKKRFLLLIFCLSCLLLYHHHVVIRTSYKNRKEPRIQTQTQISIEGSLARTQIHKFVCGVTRSAFLFVWLIHSESASDGFLAQTFRCWYNLNWMINILCRCWCPIVACFG